MKPTECDSPKMHRVTMPPPKKGESLGESKRMAGSMTKPLMRDGYQVSKVSNQSRQSAQSEQMLLRSQGSLIDKYDRLLKIIMIGAASVGKSSLLNRFIDDTYSEETLTTIGADLRSITLKINDLNIRLQIWDTAGQEQFSSMTR